MDGLRYYLQAEQNEGHSFVLHKLVVQTQAEYVELVMQDPANQLRGWLRFLVLLHGTDRMLQRPSAAWEKLYNCGDLLEGIWRIEHPSHHACLRA